MKSEKFLSADRGVAPIYCNGGVIAVGTLVLVGWWLDLPFLKSVLPGFITMKANTALLLILLALSNLLVRKEPVARTRGLLALCFSAIVIAVSCATLAEYLTGRGNGLDEFLFNDPGGASGHFPPGRLAPVTAINFILMASALLLSENRIRRFQRSAQLLMVLVFLTSFQAFVGYAVGVTYLFGSAFYTQIAVHTALSFILLSLGFLCSRPDHGAMAVFATQSTSGFVARRLIAACILVPLLVKYIQVRGEGMGLFDADFGVLVQVMGNVVLLVLIVWRTASELHETELRVRSAEAAFQQVNSQLKLISDALPALVSYSNLDEKYLFANKAYSVWFGADNNPVGKTIHEIIGAEAYLSALPSIRLVLAGKPASYEALWTLQSGKSCHVRTSYTPDFDEDGRQRGFVILVNDITDLKLAVEARDNFLSIASHELKTPITALRLQNELRVRKLGRPQFADRMTTENLLEMFRGDKRSIDRLVKHIEDMLDISRINSGKVELRFERFNLCELLSEVVDFYSPQFENSGVSISLSCPEPIFGIWDRYRLEQVFANLLTNALKYGNGSPVRMSARREGTNALVIVNDQGIGIHEADQKRIFERFERAVDVNQPSGLGLGLFLSRDIVERHRGSIDLVSKPNEGSTFTVSLPTS